MIQRKLEYAANTVLHWLRDENAAQELLDATPRGIRDRILRMLPFEGRQARRVANQITRWIGDDDGYMRIRWQEDIAARRAILRVMENALDNPQAEDDTDLVDDLTAVTYSRLADWLRQAHQDMVRRLRDFRRMELPPKQAQIRLLEEARRSLDGVA